MTENTTPAPTECTAAEVFTAAMEAPEHENPVIKAGRFVAGLASAAFGDDGSAFSGVHVVVRRKDDRSEVLRLEGGNYEGDQTLLNAVRADLDELSPEDFIQQWTVAEDVEEEG